MKKWRNFHIKFGLFFGIFFILMAVTGGVLVFRRELRPGPPALATKVGERVTVDEIIKRAELLVSAKVARIYMPKDQTKPYAVLMDDENLTKIYLSHSGDEVWRKSTNDFIKFMFQLHTGAILKKPGEIFILFVGVALLLSTLSGFLLVCKRKNIKR